jgi:hypothetical protein
MDCCRAPETALKAEPALDRCRECGAKGRRVSAETMESLLKPQALARMRDAAYFFDRSPECAVVYFSNDAESYFAKDELTVRVGIKEKDPPTPLCYCFGHTAESARAELVATGRTTIAEKIEAEIRAGNCSCEVTNPSGSCCLGEVHRAIAEIERELSREPSPNWKGR